MLSTVSPQDYLTISTTCTIKWVNQDFATIRVQSIERANLWSILALSLDIFCSESCIFIRSFNGVRLVICLVDRGREYNNLEACLVWEMITIYCIWAVINASLTLWQFITISVPLWSVCPPSYCSCFCWWLDKSKFYVITLRKRNFLIKIHIRCVHLGWMGHWIFNPAIIPP